jgi:hypothetical protein
LLSAEKQSTAQVPILGSCRPGPATFKKKISLLRAAAHTRSTTPT